MKKQKKKYLKLFSHSWEIFAANYPVEFASSFAYFSLFGLPSIFLIILLFLSVFLDINFLYEELRDQLKVIAGKESADIMVTITGNYIKQAGKDLTNALFYGVTVFLLATQLIVFFQDMLNDIWKIKPDFKNFWQKQLKERGLTSIMVIVTGILFFASVAVEKALEFTLGGMLSAGATDMLVNIITAILVFLWFATLYKVLPFGKIKWEPALVGAAVTSVLFFAGVWLLLEFAVEENRLEDLYDYVTPIVLVSFWIFYTALAFLFGASFTRAYAEMQGKMIKSTSYSYRYKIVRDEEQDE
jgi:membrane protein